jgi:hypothetical protein
LYSGYFYPFSLSVGDNSSCSYWLANTVSAEIINIHHEGGQMAYCLFHDATGPAVMKTTVGLCQQHEGGMLIFEMRLPIR